MSTPESAVGPMNPGASSPPVGPNRPANSGPPSRPPQILTRRIQILVQGETKEESKAAWQKLTDWQRMVARAANWIATHHYVQENLKELFYLTDGTRVKLTDVKKDETGILTTSRMNTTYRLLSEKFKGQIPMAIISSLNRRIVSVFDKEKVEYREGTRSLRTYKAGLPIPIAGSDVIHLTHTDGGNYSFVLYGLHFRTNLGRDRSGNAEVLQQLLEGKIKLLNSTIEIKHHKIFLLAAFPVEEQQVQLSPDVRVTAHLSASIPIVAETGQDRIEIGTRKEFLHRRLAIQEGMQRMQTTLSANRGGKGRKKKMQALERFHDKEKNYVNTRLHQYSARLIAICLRHSAGLLEAALPLTKQNACNSVQKFYVSLSTSPKTLPSWDPRQCRPNCGDAIRWNGPPSRRRLEKKGMTTPFKS